MNTAAGGVTATRGETRSAGGQQRLNFLANNFQFDLPELVSRVLAIALIYL
jgi:hypothetical protein